MSELKTKINGPSAGVATNRDAGTVKLPYTTGGTVSVKTYAFKVVVEPDEGGFHAYCPALRRFGERRNAATLRALWSW